MPAENTQVNLLGQTDLEHSTVGRLLSWATTYGRYIMVGTEIVVLLAFISRFSLDRKLTDLNDEISQKQQIIDANQDLELRMVGLQNQLVKIKALLTYQNQPLQLLTILQNSLPPDVILQSLELNKTQVKIEAQAGTTAGFSQFLATLAANKGLTQLDLGEVTKTSGQGITFQVTANLASGQNQK